MKIYIIPIILFSLCFCLFAISGYFGYIESENLKLNTQKKSISENFEKGYKAGQVDALNNVWQYKKIDGKIFKQEENK